MTEQFRKAARYIDRIRNERKRAYAGAYWRYLRGFEHEPNSDGLSVMAAQAVRLQLAEIIRGP